MHDLNTSENENENSANLKKIEAYGLINGNIIFEARAGSRFRTKKKKNYACIILSGYNVTQTQNHLVCKQTFYHIANLFAMPW